MSVGLRSCSKYQRLSISASHAIRPVHGDVGIYAIGEFRDAHSSPEMGFRVGHGVVAARVAGACLNALVAVRHDFSLPGLARPHTNRRQVSIEREVGDLKRQGLGDAQTGGHSK